MACPLHRTFVATRPRADAHAGLHQLERWVKRHKLSAFVTLTLHDRLLTSSLDEVALAQSVLLDGCYPLEMDGSVTQMDTQTGDARCDVSLEDNTPGGGQVA